jgi:hypothetical protein
MKACVALALVLFAVASSCRPPEDEPPRLLPPPPPAYAPQRPPAPPPFWQTTPQPIAQLSTDAPSRCMSAINARRQGVGLAPLERWSVAEACASTQGRDGASNGQPHGAFGRCGEMAQNVCPSWPGSAEAMIDACIDSEWKEGPGTDFGAHGHYLNLSSTKYSRVACGFFTTPNGQVWAVQDFQ